jgi:hypothetical protein
MLACILGKTLLRNIMANTTIKGLKGSPKRSSNKRESIAPKETSDITFFESKKSTA